jgi:predicted O-methyltransferase YrrM
MSTATLPTTGRNYEARRCANPVIDRIYASRAITLRDGSTRPMNVYIPREEGDHLYSLVRALRPETTVEVGMANGLSSLFIAQALRDNDHGRHIAIDPFQSSDWGSAAVVALEQAGLADLVRLIEKPSHQALPELEQDGVRVQFVFIDGSHMFDYVLTDFLCADRLLDDGGLMAFDDSDWPAITAVLRYVLTNRHYEAAFPDVVIEKAWHRPTLAGRALRAAARAVPKLGARLRPDFLTPSYDRGIRGRCVVLRKLGPDDRDSQTQFFNPF